MVDYLQGWGLATPATGTKAPTPKGRAPKVKENSTVKGAKAPVSRAELPRPSSDTHQYEAGTSGDCYCGRFPHKFTRGLQGCECVCHWPGPNDD